MQDAAKEEVFDKWFYMQGFLDHLQSKIVHLHWPNTYGVGQGAQR